MLWIGTLYVLTGLLFMGLSVPLIQKRIGPNPWYGFRTRKTLSDKEIWYAANRRGGVLLFIAGAVIAGGALLLVPLVWLLRLGLPHYTLACLILMLLSVTCAAILSYLYIARL